MRSKLDKLIKLTVILPPLAMIAIWGYSSFISSNSFQYFLSHALKGILCADIKMDAHHVEGVFMRRVVIDDLKTNLHLKGKPVGVLFNATSSVTDFSGLPGANTISKITLSGIDMVIPQDSPPLMELDYVTLTTVVIEVPELELNDMSFTIETENDIYKIPDTHWVMSTSAEHIAIKGGVKRLIIKGGDLDFLNKEGLNIELDAVIKSDFVDIKNLKIASRSGWAVELSMTADLKGDSPKLKGTMELWGLSVSRIVDATEGVSITANAEIERTVKFEGPLEKLRVEVSTNIKNLTYEDEGLGLKAEGVTVDQLMTAETFNMPVIIKELLDSMKDSQE